MAFSGRMQGFTDLPNTQVAFFYAFMTLAFKGQKQVEACGISNFFTSQTPPKIAFPGSMHRDISIAKHLSGLFYGLLKSNFEGQKQAERGRISTCVTSQTRLKIEFPSHPSGLSRSKATYGRFSNFGLYHFGGQKTG